MKFKLEIDLDNAAFEDDQVGELERILKQAVRSAKAARTVEIGMGWKLHDSNGNTVGKWEVA